MHRGPMLGVQGVKLGDEKLEHADRLLPAGGGDGLAVVSDQPDVNLKFWSNL